MTATAMSFLESIELAEGFLAAESPNLRSGSGSARSWHSPRISFSNEFAQLGGGDPDHSPPKNSNVGSGSSPSHNPSSSGEFEFSSGNAAVASDQAPIKNSPMLSADELFYKGKLLPLHLPPRIRMVQDLSQPGAADLSASAISFPPAHRQIKEIKEIKQQGIVTRSPPMALMRRERSLRSPARPSALASTLKSSSYPPPGYSSRPSSPPRSGKCSSGGTSRWRELFGFQRKSISSPKSSSSSSSGSSSSSSSSSFLSKQAVPSKLLKMIFNRGGGNGATTAANSNENSPDDPEIESGGGAADALVPLLRDCAASSSNDPELLVVALHSSSVSSSSSNSSSNWAASSASSSTSSLDSHSLDEIAVAARSRKAEAIARRGGGVPSGRARRSPAARSQAPLQQSALRGGALQRSASNRKAANSSATSLHARMQLQDHIAVARSHGENNWRRPLDHKSSASASSSSSSVRVTPVLHVPACIGPSLRSVRVHGLRKLFSSPSSSAANSRDAAASKADRSVAVM